ncbi:hypothetical protein WJX72_011768 [[Myrmecia] bisecta]|uniref:Pre-mRNA polyadenylation factor Fip1 domain-containing protein n=1 Tax=[Myrmecia] bisecta TaxID=41462 RepID=A0AAW1QGI9_9CHLO
MPNNQQGDAADDNLYSEIFGEEAPQGSEHPPSSQQRLPAVTGSALLQHPHTASVTGASRAEQPLAAPAAPPVGPTAGQELASTQDDEEDDLDIMLDAPAPYQAGLGMRKIDDDDDDFEVMLDEQAAVPPPSAAAAAAAAGGPFRYVRPGAEAPQRPSVPSLPAGSSATPAGTGPAAGGASALPAGRAPLNAAPSAGVAGLLRAQPGGLPALRGDPVLPSQAAPGQPIRLPGQTRVTPDEYKEFLGLGHGEVFNLDIDRVQDAPWRQPGADPSDFFNYGLNPASWKQYCKRIELFRLEFTMQSKIQTYEGAAGMLDQDPDLPPELAAAVAAEYQQHQAPPGGPGVFANGIRPPFQHGPGVQVRGPRPPPHSPPQVVDGVDRAQEPSDAIISLAETASISEAGEERARLDTFQLAFPPPFGLPFPNAGPLDHMHAVPHAMLPFPPAQLLEQGAGAATLDSGTRSRREARHSPAVRESGTLGSLAMGMDVDHLLNMSDRAAPPGRAPGTDHQSSRWHEGRSADVHRHGSDGSRKGRDRYPDIRRYELGDDDRRDNDRGHASSASERKRHRSERGS